MKAPEEIVRRTLITPRLSNEDNRFLTNIFRTRCTAGGKVCNVIIFGGSCENMVSLEMVDKFKLKLEKHPHPTKISWFLKGNEVLVDKRCLVTFSIGKSYKDAIWCDVVPMDACHLLLGRPWQFDRKVIHDGEKNTHTFWKDGAKVVLLPLLEGVISVTRQTNGMQAENLLTRRKFETEARETGVVYARLTKDASPTPN